MIEIKVKDNESIDKALKRFKKKFERTKVLREIRGRAYYEKPSIARRNQKTKSLYKQRKRTEENQ